MITHHLKVAVRNLLKYKTQTFISILGLAIGLACFIFSLHWLRYETSYDNFYPNADRTYLIYTLDENNKIGESPNALADFIRIYLPEAEVITRSYKGGQGNIDYLFDETLIKNPNFTSVDSNFIHIFPKTILYGRSLQHADEIILSQSFARKHFGDPQKAIGTILYQTAPKGLHLIDARQLHVVGIMDDEPLNSTMISNGYYQQPHSRKADIHNPKDWRYNLSHTHLILKKGIKEKEFTTRLHRALQQFDFLKEKSFKVIPLYQKHFEFASEDSFSYSAIFMFILATGLLLCCILFNFINLFLNRYYQRMREIKLRKSVGANTPKLLQQVIIEILSYSILGGLACGCLMELSIPLFEKIFSITIVHSIIWKEFLLTNLVFILVICGILLPLTWLFLRSVSQQSLTGKPQDKGRNQIRRIGLIIQLTICLFFFASGMSLHQQLYYMNHSDLGFDIEHTVEFMVRSFEQNAQDMLEEIKQLPMIEQHVTSSQYMVSKEGMYTNNNLEWKGKTEEDKNTQFAQINLTQNGDQIFNFRLKEGRTYTNEDWISIAPPINHMNEHPVLNRILVNESTAKAMHLTHPIGEIIRIPFQLLGKEPIYTDYEIIGVIQDFHTQGMKAQPIPTLIFQNSQINYYIHYFQVTPGTESQTLKAINQLAEKHHWQYNGMNEPPQLLSEKMNKLNLSETATFRLFVVLTLLCIFISLFGIFSISSSTIQQRRKEIAIRKVMGAKSKEISQMFFREYSWLVGLSAMIAFPFFYYLISKWLEQFPYRVSISMHLYIILSILIAILVLLTVFRQVKKAANENPAEVINNE